MNLAEWTGEIIATTAALFTGAWAMTKLAIKTREDIETRLDRHARELSELKSKSVTHTELTQAIKEIEDKLTQAIRNIEDKNERFYQRMDVKVDSINSNMMWIMQAMGKDK